MSLTLKGKLTRILPADTGVSRAGNAWKKQEFVMETEEQYPKTVCLTLFNDKVSALSGIEPGDLIEVSFDVESREFNNKFYHNLNAWKVTRINTATNHSANQPPPYTEGDIPPEPADDQYGDLPF